MRSTMMDTPLTITSIMRYGTTIFGDREVVTCTGDGTRRRTYAEAGRRAARLANALRRLGVDADQRVGTYMWNNAEHLEAYLAVPSMGAVLHTLNIRLAPAEDLVGVRVEDRHPDGRPAGLKVDGEDNVDSPPAHEARTHHEAPAPFPPHVGRALCGRSRARWARVGASGGTRGVYCGPPDSWHYQVMQVRHP